MMIDEISLLLGKRIVTKVATLAQISDILKKTEQSQARAGRSQRRLRARRHPRRRRRGDETHLDRQADRARATSARSSAWWTPRSSPPCSGAPAIFTSRPATIRSYIKFRIDGVLQQAMPPIAKEHHSTIISRIKVMSELDISERRVPQDGRFRVRYDSRAPHRLPRLHHAVDSRRRCRAPRARQRVDEREVPQAHARRGRLRAKKTCASSAATSKNPTAWCWSPGRPVAARRRRSTPR